MLGAPNEENLRTHIDLTQQHGDGGPFLLGSKLFVGTRTEHTANLGQAKTTHPRFATLPLPKGQQHRRTADMDKVLVTGGCGFLGSHIVRKLIERGVGRVRVLALPNETTQNIEDLDVDVVRGNVLSPDDCTTAVEGVDTVFHAAAIYKAFMPDPTMMYEVNSRGTFNMLEASRRSGVDKVIYTASIVSLGRPPEGQLGDEDTQYEAWDIPFAYSLSKYHSRKIAEDFARWGLDVRIVYPGGVFGPADIAPTPSGKIIIQCLQTRPLTQVHLAMLERVRGQKPDLMPAMYVDGGMSFVDVRDCAEVHIRAAERGRPNRGYVATAHNLTQGEFVDTVARSINLGHNFVKIPTPLARRIVGSMEKVAAKSNEEPALTASFFEYTLKPSFFSNRRSVEELGATYRPIEDTIRDAVEYFREVGYVT